jgi:hypothetical protein
MKKGEWGTRKTKVEQPTSDGCSYGRKLQVSK